jgi:hypothetical protein
MSLISDITRVQNTVQTSIVGPASRRLTDIISAATALVNIMEVVRSCLSLFRRPAEVSITGLSRTSRISEQPWRIMSYHHLLQSHCIMVCISARRQFARVILSTNSNETNLAGSGESGYAVAMDHTHSLEQVHFSRKKIMPILSGLLLYNVHSAREAMGSSASHGSQGHVCI